MWRAGKQVVGRGVWERGGGKDRIRWHSGPPCSQAVQTERWWALQGCTKPDQPARLQRADGDDVHSADDHCQAAGAPLALQLHANLRVVGRWDRRGGLTGKRGCSGAAAQKTVLGQHADSIYKPPMHAMPMHPAPPPALCSAAQRTSSVSSSLGTSWVKGQYMFLRPSNAQ